MLSVINQRNFLAIVILATSSSVLSKDISYDFVEGGYASTNVDIKGVGEAEFDGDSFGIAASSSTTKNMALTFALGTSSFEGSQNLELDRILELDTISASVGLTAHTLITNRISLFGNFSLLSTKLKVFGEPDDTDFGNITTIGLRYMATDSIEINAAFSHTRIFDGIVNSLEGGARFYVDKKFSLGIGYAVIDNRDGDSESILLSARVDM